MKLLPVFLPVVALHVGLIILFLAQPGCQTRKPPPAPAGAESVSQPAQSAPTVARQPAPASAQQPSTRQPPMRPVGTGATSNLDPAFNADLPIESDVDVLRPIIEPEPFVEESAQTYTVVGGDTLSSIARNYGVSVADIRTANNLSGDRILLGQELLIPSPTQSASSISNSSMSNADTDTYVVAPGDNLTRIAQRMGSSVAEIRAANGLSSDRILVGQTLIIPTDGTGQSAAIIRPTSSRSISGATYVVAPGDTLSVIGARYGVNYRRIMEANGITDPTRLYVGQELVIPGVSETSVTPVVESRPRPSIVPPIEPRGQPQVDRPSAVEPTRPVQPQPEQIDPAELEALLDELPISESEVVEPTE